MGSSARKILFLHLIQKRKLIICWWWCMKFERLYQKICSSVQPLLLDISSALSWKNRRKIVKTKLWSRCGSRTGERNGENVSATYLTPALTSAREASVPSSTGWCSPSPRTLWRATATRRTTTGPPKCQVHLSPKALPGASTPHLCTIRPGMNQKSF